MTVYETLCKDAQTLPENLQIEALHYINFLQEKFSTKTTRVSPVQAENETNQTTETPKTKQQLAYEWLNDMASKPHSFNDVDALAWQQEQRSDKVLAGREF